MSNFKLKVDLLKILDDELIKQNSKERYRPPRRVPTIWPTEASVQWRAENGALITEGACHRAVYYRLTGAEKTEEVVPRMHWVWQTGNWWEDECNRLGKKSDILVANSVRFFDYSVPLPVSGEMDAVYKVPDDPGDSLFVVDYKSTGGSYYGNVKLLGNRSTKPFPKVEALLQLMVYLKQDTRLAFGMLLYLVRDKMERTQFHIELEEDEQLGARIAKVNGKTYPQYSLEEIYRRYEILCDYYMRKELPPRDYDYVYSMERAQELFDVGQITKTAKADVEKGKDRGDWRCSYCNYRTKCLADTAKEEEEKS